jgi:hypothetical protein
MYTAFEERSTRAVIIMDVQGAINHRPSKGSGDLSGASEEKNLRMPPWQRKQAGVFRAGKEAAWAAGEIGKKGSRDLASNREKIALFAVGTQCAREAQPKNSFILDPTMDQGSKSSSSVMVILTVPP